MSEFLYIFVLSVDYIEKFQLHFKPPLFLILFEIKPLKNKRF